MNRKKSNCRLTASLAATAWAGLLAGQAIASSGGIPNLRPADQTGLNVFEVSGGTDSASLKVEIHGSSALQLQGLDHTNGAPAGDDNALVDIGSNFNLATANLDVDTRLHRGVSMHLRTYLSSRHHSEAWVKGGYFQVDRLDFIAPGFLDPLMDHVSVRMGHMETNYGDAHFRRTDNAMALHNPFVGNTVMDAFTTEVGGELTVTHSGFLAMAGFTNGKLNQNVLNPGDTHLSLLGKLGYDRQVREDLRLRLTGSIYRNGKMERVSLYTGDRAGARYYSVMRTADSDDFRSGRFDPKFAREVTAIMVNPFVKWMGLEFFGLAEWATGGDATAADETHTVSQYAAEVLYRFGPRERFYAGARYNTVMGKLSNDQSDVRVDRYQGAVGWFLTPNVLAKGEYVVQDYRDFPASSVYSAGNFEGFVLEAAISF